MATDVVVDLSADGSCVCSASQKAIRKGELRLGLVLGNDSGPQRWQVIVRENEICNALGARANCTPLLVHHNRAVDRASRRACMARRKCYPSSSNAAWSCDGAAATGHAARAGQQ
jgi:hypothetical protein